MSQPVEMRKNVPSGTIILNRPLVHNALDQNSIAELEQALLDFQGEKSVRGVILTGAGSLFCSGSDLKEIHAIAREPDAADRWQVEIEKIQELLEVMLRYPKPIIVALNGDAHGLGVAIALAADIIIGTPESRLFFSESKFGLSNCVSAALLAFRVGAGPACAPLLSGQALPCDRAHQFGLISEVVPTELVWAKAHEWVSGIARQSHQSTNMTKRFINETVGENLFTQISIAFAQLAAARTTDAAKEGLEAFIAKRSPQF